VKNKLFHEPKVHPTRDIVEKCLQFEADGAHAIYLMATAAVKLPEFPENRPGGQSGH
jgi:biotin synthase